MTSSMRFSDGLARSTALAIMTIALLLLCGCQAARSQIREVLHDDYFRDGRHFAVAVYNDAGCLISAPLEKVTKDIEVADEEELTYPCFLAYLKAIRKGLDGLDGTANDDEAYAKLKALMENGFRSLRPYKLLRRRMLFEVSEARKKQLPFQDFKPDARAILVQARSDFGGYTDLYVLAHGWNFTVPEAISNYADYIDYLDGRFRQLTPLVREYMGRSKRTAEAPRFKPYLLLVVYDSISRPFQDAASSLLPFGLENLLKPITYPIDTLAFHLPSAWGESIGAFTIALGNRYPCEYRTENYNDARKHRPRDADAPMSLLLRSLFALNVQRSVEKKPRFILHCVGHSYGAKVLALASIEAVLAWKANGVTRQDVPRAVDAGSDSDRAKAACNYNSPIESLLLFNPAFHPRELEYFERSLKFIEEDDVQSALVTIPRKAVVYTSWDFALGLPFDISEIILNKAHLQDSHQLAKGLETGTMLDYVTKPVTGTLQLAYAAVISPTIWVGQKVINLPFDWCHHVVTNTTFGSDKNGKAPVWAMPLNAVHFFVPLDQIFISGRQGDQGGILRYNRPGLGVAGLYRMRAARPRSKSPVVNLWMDDLRALDDLVPSPEEVALDPSKRTDFDRDTFANMGDLTRKHGFPGWQPDLFYSFDAGLVYSREWKIEGAHGALRSPDPVTELPGSLSKRDYTIGFVIRATKMTAPFGEAFAPMAPAR